MSLGDALSGQTTGGDMSHTKQNENATTRVGKPATKNQFAVSRTRTAECKVKTVENVPPDCFSRLPPTFLKLPSFARVHETS